MSVQQPVAIPAAPLSPDEERQWAMLAHLSVLLNLITGFLGILGALLIYVLFRARSRYVAYQSLQALVMQLIWWFGGGMLTGIVWTITGALSAVLVGLLCIPLACVVSLMPVVALMYGTLGGLKAHRGEDFRYWLIGEWLRGTLTE
jgi:hypothetical protein